MPNLTHDLAITGGAGYIGAHVVEEALKSGRDIVVLDDLSTGDVARLPSNIDIERVTLTDANSVESVFAKHNTVGALHLAAKKRVGESVQRPDYYWQENVGGFQNLVSTMKNHEVKNLVFVSSAAVYGAPEIKPGQTISEIEECLPINPYGLTKLEGEVISKGLVNTDGFKVASLRYFNVAGASNSELGDQFVFNLVPLVFEAIDAKLSPKVFGSDYSTPDGSCIRDYVHVQDLAEAHVAAMDLVETMQPGFEAINLGTGVGASVFEVMSMIQNVTGIELNPEIVDRRIGDPAALVADVSKAKEILGWESRFQLREIVESAWQAWQASHK
jgi:UDP-glucose 4-epimerase